MASALQNLIARAIVSPKMFISKKNTENSNKKRTLKAQIE
jgi:hypothetical protein